MNIISIDSAKSTPAYIRRRNRTTQFSPPEISDKVIFLNQITICPTLVTPGKIKRLQEYVRNELDGDIKFTYCGDSQKLKVIYTANEPLPHLLSEYSEYSINQRRA